MSAQGTVIGSDFQESEAKNPGIFFVLIELSNAGILRGVYPERNERAQNDRQWGYPLRMTDIAYQTCMTHIFPVNHPRESAKLRPSKRRDCAGKRAPVSSTTAYQRSSVGWDPFRNAGHSRPAVAGRE